MLPPSPPETETRSETGEPPRPAEIARCAVHPERPAHARCERCAKPACASCARVRASGETLCAACEEAALPTIPWERRAELGIARAALQTIAGVILRPGALFAMRTRERSIAPALAFGMVMQLLAQAVICGLDLAFLDAQRAELRADPIGRQMMWLASPELALGQLAATPLTFLVGTMIGASLWWLGLRAVGGLRRPFHVIVRSLCYAQATSLLVLIAAPLSHAGPAGQGAVLAIMLWSLGIQIVAVSRMQGIDGVRAIAAFFVTAALGGCLVCVVGTAALWGLATQIQLPPSLTTM